MSLPHIQLTRRRLVSQHLATVLVSQHHATELSWTASRSITPRSKLMWRHVCVLRPQPTTIAFPKRWSYVQQEWLREWLRRPHRSISPRY